MCCALAISHHGRRAAATPAHTMDQESKGGQSPAGKRSGHSVSCYRVSVPTQTATRSDAVRNHARLVAAARDLFARNGLDVSVEEITQHAGVGMGTLYRHFPTKDELIDAVLEDAFAEILALAERAAAAEDAWAGLTSFLEGVLELRFQNRGVRELIESGNRGARHAEMRKRIRPVIRRLIERAQAQGTLRPDFKLD